MGSPRNGLFNALVETCEDVGQNTIFRGRPIFSVQRKTEGGVAKIPLEQSCSFLKESILFIHLQTTNEHNGPYVEEMELQVVEGEVVGGPERINISSQGLCGSYAKEHIAKDGVVRGR